MLGLCVRTATVTHGLEKHMHVHSSPDNLTMILLNRGLTYLLVGPDSGKPSSSLLNLLCMVKLICPSTKHLVYMCHYKQICVPYPEHLFANLSHSTPQA